LFEDVLFNLPPIYKKDDIIKEVSAELTRLREMTEKNREKNKIELLDRFKVIVTQKISLNSSTSQSLDDFINSFLGEIKRELEKMLIKREKHKLYLTKLNDLLAFVNFNAENAKTNYTYALTKIEEFVKNIDRGYANHFAAEKNAMVKILKSQKKKVDEKKNVLKKFLVVDLIKRKVIKEILFDKKEQPKLVQKSYIEFEKEENGYRMRLNYKEKYRKYILCGTSNHDYKLEEHIITNEHLLAMRRLARNNPVQEFGDMSFNVFYLVKLLNSLEAE
jgi:hypothetical protein